MKSILILDTNNVTQLFTEGQNDCTKITEKLYYANGAMVIISFGSLPTLTFYNCRFLISQNLILNPTLIYPALNCAHRIFSSTDLKTDGIYSLIPAPPAGMCNLLSQIFVRFIYGGVAFTNSNSGGLILRTGANDGGTAIFTYSDFKRTASYFTSMTPGVTYVNASANNNQAISLHLNCTNITGNSTLEVFTNFLIVPAL